MDKRYIAIFEDGTVSFLKDKLPDEIVSAADDGYYHLIDISNPDQPKEYCNGEWIMLQ
jgi:hypothetical protein